MNGKSQIFTLVDEAETLNLGKKIAVHLPFQFILYLHGALGVGKTTLVRGLLHGLGYTGRVKSPTYTFVEPYHINVRSVYHFDLYRLNHPYELETLSIRDYFSHPALIIIEWPEKGEGLLPSPDLNCYIEIVKQHRTITCSAPTPQGKKLLSHL